MYLVNVSTLQLEEFIGDEIPPYAILSHRWEKDELTFKEIRKNRCDRSKAGYCKMKSACKIAANLGLLYLWIDTCCINKRSSAELSEAINSMFRWYYNARVCIVYLSDVLSPFIPNDIAVDPLNDFIASLWFTRSWTLQELLAPQEIEFYNHVWEYIGTKKTLEDSIQRASRIPLQALEDRTSINDFSISQRMSWASGRMATRIEDQAYCLLGILMSICHYCMEKVANLSFAFRNRLSSLRLTAHFSSGDLTATAVVADIS